jgi:hypothetical protein
MPLRTVSLDELTIDDEQSVGEVPLYPRLKRALVDSGHRFCLPEGEEPASWDRVVFLNLTYWTETGVDVLCDDHIAADVVAHAAWHEVVSRGLTKRVTAAVGSAAGSAAPGRSPAALFFGESIASAFDLYLVGRLWRSAPGSDFISSQVPIMSEAAQQAGLSDEAFAGLLSEIAEDPERAFEEMRALLFDAGLALLACGDPLEAQRTMEGFSEHRFSALLHHYQLSNWILYARAYAQPAPALDAIVRDLDAQLRNSDDPLAWLAEVFL